MYKQADSHQETMFGPLTPLTNLGYFTGAIPYPLCTNDLSPLQKLLRLVQILFETVLVFGLIASVVVLRVNTKEYCTAEQAPPFIKLFYVLEHVLDIFLVIGICYGEQFLRVNFKDLLDQLDDLLQTFGHVSAEIVSQRKLFAVFAILANLAVQVVVLWSSLEAEPNIRFVPLLITVHVPLMLTVIFVQMYCFVVSSMVSMVQRINKSLETLVRRFSPPFNQEKPPYQEISRLRKIHLQIVDLLEQVNSATGVILISILSSTFVNINSHSLFLYNKIKEDSHPPGFTRSIIEICMLMLLRLLKVLAVVTPNSLLKVENHKAAKILCEFEETDNQRFNWTINRYLQQLNELKDVHSACGLIQLDLPLVVTMIGALATYMIILIQFNDSNAPTEISALTTNSPTRA